MAFFINPSLDHLSYSSAASNSAALPRPGPVVEMGNEMDHNALALAHAAVLFLRIIGPTRQRKKLEGASEPFYSTVGHQACSGAIAMFVMDQHAFFLHRKPT